MSKPMEYFKDLSKAIDTLLFELCEAGIYELYSENSPEGYKDVAVAADKLNQLSDNTPEGKIHYSQKEQV